MASRRRRSVEAYQADVLTEVDRDWRRGDRIVSGARLVQFVSESGGRGRRRAPRSVRLLVVGGYAWDLGARRHRTTGRPRLDVVLDELTDGLAVPDDRPKIDWVVEALERWGTP